jgi:hypothetical protein
MDFLVESKVVIAGPGGFVRAAEYSYFTHVWDQAHNTRIFMYDGECFLSLKSIDYILDNNIFTICPREDAVEQFSRTEPLFRGDFGYPWNQANAAAVLCATSFRCE